MKLHPDELERLQSRLTLTLPETIIRLDEIEIHTGPTPHAPVPALTATMELGDAPVEPDRLVDLLREAFPAIFDDVTAKVTDLSDTAVIIASAVARLAAAFAAQVLEMDIDLRSGLAWTENRKAAVWIELFEPDLGVHALGAALMAVARALTGDGGPHIPSREELAPAGVIAVAARPNFESGILIAAARCRGIPARRIGDDHAIWQFGWGSRGEQIWVTSTNRDGVTAQRLSRNKRLGKLLMAELGLPTPEWRVIGLDDDPGPAADAVGWPCVVKPLSGGAGRGVSTNLRTMADLQHSVSMARRYDQFTLIEAHEPGEDHRLMVIDGRLVAAVRRDFPAVIGDGLSTIGELVAELNGTRFGPEREVGYLSPVPDDAELVGTLAAQGFTKDSILAAGRKVLLRTNANRSTGGTATDVLGKVHPQVRMMAEQLAGAFGFRATGIDYMTRDVSRSHDDVGGAILEVNTTPGFRVLLASGYQEDTLGARILGRFPGRIPLLLVVAAAEEIAQIDRLAAARLPPTAGLAFADSAQIGSMRLPRRTIDASAWLGALMLYPNLKAVIVAWSADDLAVSGLPADAMDLTVIVRNPLSRAWMATLRTASADLVCVGGAESAVERLLSSGLLEAPLS
jgi:cyanophycin synthetase